MGDDQTQLCQGMTVSYKKKARKNLSTWEMISNNSLQPYKITK